MMVRRTDEADRLADRLRHEAGPDAARQIDRAYRLCLARKAQPDEIVSASRFVAERGLAPFCRVLFNSNEFVYVD